MTSIETKKDNLRKEIGKLTRELELLETITYLGKQLEELERLPCDVELDDVIESIDDFATSISNRSLKRRFQKLTVRELLYTHPEDLWGRSVGPKSLQQLLDWVESHNLKFLSISDDEFKEWKERRHLS